MPYLAWAKLPKMVNFSRPPGRQEVREEAGLLARTVRFSDWLDDYPSWLISMEKTARYQKRWFQQCLDFRGALQTCCYHESHNILF